MNQQVHFKPERAEREAARDSAPRLPRDWRRNLPLGLVGGVLLMSVAAAAQGISFGFDKLSWISLGTPFVLGSLATWIMLYLMQRNLDQQRLRLEREFGERTAQLVETEKRFDEYGAAAKEWFWETDTEDRFVFLSSRLYEASGIRPEEVLGRKRESMRVEPLSEADREMWADYQHCIDNRLPFEDLRYTSRVADGSEIIYCSSGKPFFDDDGHFLGYRGIARDATGEVLEERRRRADHDLIYHATAVLSDGFYIFDADDRLIMCNQRFREIFSSIADMLEPGMPYEKLLRTIAERQIVFASDAERHDWIEATIADHANPGEPFEEHLATGEWIRVVKRRTADGNIVGLCVDITATKRIEEELAEAQRISNIGSYRQDFLSDTMLSFSEQMVRIYGLEPDDIDPLNNAYMYDRVYSEDRERVHATYEQARLREVTEPGALLFEIEYRIVRPDGEVRNILERTDVSKIRDGRAVEIIGTLQDITDTRRIEQELEQGQLIAGIGTFRWDFDRDVAISCSPEVARIVGRPVDEFMHLGDEEYLRDVVHPDDRERMREALRRSSDSGEGYFIEYRLVRPDGEIRYVVERAEAVAMQEGRVAEYLCTLQDVTASKSIEQELEAAQTVARVGSYRWNNEQHRMESFSKEYLRIHGRSEAEMRALGMDGLVNEIIHPDDRAHVRETFERSATNDETYEVEYRIRRPDGEYRQIIERCSTLIRRGDKVVEQLGTLQDISERMLFEKELEAAQRIARVGSFRWDVLNDRLLSATPEFERIMGRPLQELLESPEEHFERGIHPDDHERVMRAYAESNVSDDVVEIEYRVLREDGTRHFVERLAPSVWRDGRIIEQIGTLQDITDRRRIERDLEDAQSIARLGSFRWDTQRQCIISCSAEYLSILGRDADTVPAPGEDPFQLVHPDDMELLNEAYLHKGDEDVEMEYRIIRKDGETRYINERLRPLRWREGVLVEQIGTMQDVTARKLLELEFEMAQRLANVGSFTWDVEGACMISCTDEFLRIYDLDRNSMMRMPEEELLQRHVHPHDRDRVRDHYAKSEFMKEMNEIEYRLLRRSGEVRYVIERLSAAIWRDGKAVEQIGTLQDVTERRLAELDKRASDEVLEAAIENVPGGFLMVDRDGVINRFNRRFFDLYPRQQFYINEGVPLDRFFEYGVECGVYAEAVDDPQAWLEKRHEQTGAAQIEFIDRLGDGRTIQIASRRLPNGTRVAIHVDVTDLANARQAAERANAAKSDFLASMSHELRTPMHGILSFAELGIKRLETLSQEKLKQYLENIQVSGNRLLYLLNDLLDLSKLEAGKMSLDIAPLNLVDLVQACINEQSLQLRESRLDCKLISSESGARCLCDRNRIYQVISNVVSNAIKFSPEGGRIEIRMERVDKGYRVGVADQGIGIPEDELDQIFDKFYQSARSRNHSGGTGLGLAICREIIELHGGRIWAENNPDQGSRIIFEIPAEARLH